MTSFQPQRPPEQADQGLLKRVFGFRTRLYLTWLVMFALFAGFFLSFDLKLAIILEIGRAHV